MPSVIKQKTPTSPGIITFTANEMYNGIGVKSARLREHLLRTVNREWLYGVHLQGDWSYLQRWPQADWQSFVMWADPQDPLFAEFPRERFLGMSCVHFTPEPDDRLAGVPRHVDLCVISRASTIKRIYDTMLIVRSLMNRRPDLKVTFLVPDMRGIDGGTDPRFFELPTKLFNADELKNIDFVCVSTRVFGRFPVSVELMELLLRRSKFLFLTSHQEGTPRVFADAWMTGAACIVSENLYSGLNRYFTEANTLKINDGIERAAAQIDDALTNYDRFDVDQSAMREIFSAKRTTPVFKERLSAMIRAQGRPVEGEWYLDDLHLRLACHGQKHNYQFMNDDELFFSWLAKIESGVSPYDEDRLFGAGPIVDEPKFFDRPAVKKARKNAGKVVSKLEAAVRRVESRFDFLARRT